MNINRHNYEEYFLLYADNELSVAEKAQVDLFVRQNPDLEEELIMLRQAVLVPEPTISFGSKDLLYRKEEFITPENCEKIFVLYHDNELNAEERHLTESFLNRYPEQKKLFVELEKSKLTAERISFPHKKLLYKKVESGSIVPLYMWRAAAALLIIILSIYAGMWYMKSDRSIDVVIKDKPSLTLPQKQQIPQEKVDEPEQQSQAHDLLVDKEDKQQRRSGDAVIRSIDPKVVPQVAPDARSIVKLQPVATQVLDNANSASEDNEDVAVSRSLSNNLPEVIEQRRPEFDALETINANGPIHVNSEAVAFQASYKNEEDSNKDNYVFYNISEEKFKKSKVGIFLKKVKRVVSRNTIGKIAKIDTDSK
jgi:hypothetical protein